MRRQNIRTWSTKLKHWESYQQKNGIISLKIDIEQCVKVQTIGIEVSAGTSMTINEMSQ